MNKYELTNEIRHFYGVDLHRIRALRDFGNVKAGDLGGWTERYENLSQTGAAWVFDSGIVCDSGVVRDSGVVSDSRDILIFTNIGSAPDGVLTAYRNAEGGISVSRGCFSGTLDEFAAAVTKTHGTNKMAREYALAIELIQLKLGK